MRRMTMIVTCRDKSMNSLLAHRGVTSTARTAIFRAANLPQTNLAEFIPVYGLEIKFLDGCNRSCSFCVNEDDIGIPLNLIDTEKMNQSIHDVLDAPSPYGMCDVVYGTGGEPLMVVEKVVEIFKPLGNRGVATCLVTNGLVLNERRLHQLCDAYLTGIKITCNTLDGERLVQLQRGGGLHDVHRLVRNIANAKAAGLFVFVRIGLGKINANEVLRIYERMAKIGIDVLQIKPWVPSGRAAYNRGDLSLSPHQLRNVFAELAPRIAQSRRPEVTVSCFPPARDYGFTVKDCANVAKIYCEPNGNARVCNFVDSYLGSWLPENGGLRSVLERRRTRYADMMDCHGVKTCPARWNWSAPDTHQNQA